MAEPKKADALPIPDVATLQAQVESLTAQVATLLRTMAVERPVALPLAEQQRREEQFERMKEELSKPCDVRTQEAAERLWGTETKKRFEVCVVTKTDGKSKPVAVQPRILVPAGSVHEARGRYDELCGIRSVDGELYDYKIQPAQAAA